VLLLVSVILLAACSTQPDAVRGIEYIDGQRLDIHPPDPSIVSPPVVVLFHGAGLDKGDYETFAQGLAEAGALVFNVDWDVLPPTKQVALEQIACAVRFARAEGSDRSADTSRMVLVGHSTAAVFTGEVATRGDRYTGACPTKGSALPAALALLSPAQVTGGAPWDLQTLGGNPGLQIGIVHGVDDEVARPTLSERIERDLSRAGYDVELHFVGGGHYDVVMIDDGDPTHPQPGLATISVILDLVESET
jgi:predicted esterase